MKRAQVEIPDSPALCRPGEIAAPAPRTGRVLGVAAAWALLLVAGAANAERVVSWSFEVLEVTRIGRHEHLIRLRPSPPGRKFPRSCGALVVHARFDVAGWNPAARDSVTRASHERSLQWLLQARVTRDLVRIGVVGRGFGALPEKPRCEVASRALQFAVDRDGTSGVLSLFEEPSDARGDGS